MEEITQQAYWEEVESIAKSVTEEAREEGTEICEVVHEAVDSHQWVIYTYANAQVMQWTDNADALTETYGGDLLDGKQTWGEVCAVFAYCALEADVMNHSEFGAEPEEENES